MNRAEYVLEEPSPDNRFLFTVKGEVWMRRFYTMAEALEWIAQQGGVVVERPLPRLERPEYGEAVFASNGDQYISY